MHAALTGLALVAGAHAAVTGSQGCCFGITATGGPGGQLSQLSDGQNRIGQTSGVEKGSYCINNGTLTDSNGRGCILTPPTGQFQCDAGAHPSQGFAVESSGALTLHDSDKFWACPTGDHGGWNIYSDWLKYQTKCVQVTLSADISNCNAKPSHTAPQQSSSTPATSMVPEYTPHYMPHPHRPTQAKPYVVTETDCTTFTVSKTRSIYFPAKPTSKPVVSTLKPATPQFTCPSELTGNFEFPHLMVPVDRVNGNKAYGNSLNGTISSTLSTVFNFDIPASDAGKQCTLEFLFPTQDNLETSAYSFHGAGKMSFHKLTAPATEETTFNTLPSVHQHLGDYTVTPGTATAVSSYTCAAGQKIAFMMSSADGSSLNYFQDYNPCPIGLYITVE